MKLLKLLALISFCTMVIVSAGCSGNKNSIDKKTAFSGGNNLADTDNDGLLDVEEFALGTSPDLEDTDGDRMTDWEEVSEMGFNPDVDPFCFNPLIADVPFVEVKITSPPIVALNYIYSDSTSESITNQRVKEIANTYTNMNGGSHSAGWEKEWGIAGTVGVDGWKLVASATSHYNSKWQGEDTYNWSEEQAAENRYSYVNAMTAEEIHEISATSGRIAVSIDLINHSNQMVRLSNLVIPAFQRDLVNPSIHYPMANLEIDTWKISGTTIDLPPGGRCEGLNCYDANMYPDDAKGLLKDSRGLTLSPANFTTEIQVENQLGTRQWASPDLTSVYSRTAKVIVEYGVYSTKSPAIRECFVATGQDGSSSGVTARQIMDLMRLEYETGTTSLLGLYEGLISVEGEQADESINGYWLVFHLYKEEGEVKAKLYDIRLESYDFENIVVNTGDVLHLLYVEDHDNDGLTARVEMVMMTSDDNPDTDGDGTDDPADPFPTIPTQPADAEPLDEAGKFEAVANMQTDTTIPLVWEMPADDRVAGFIIAEYGPEDEGLPTNYVDYRVGYEFRDGGVVVYRGNKDVLKTTIEGLAYNSTHAYKIFTYDAYCCYSPAGIPVSATTDAKWKAWVEIKAWQIYGREVIIPFLVPHLYWNFWTLPHGDTVSDDLGHVDRDHWVGLQLKDYINYPCHRTELGRDTLCSVEYPLSREENTELDDPSVLLSITLKDEHPDGDSFIANDERFKILYDMANDRFTCSYNADNGWTIRNSETLFILDDWEIPLKELTGTDKEWDDPLPADATDEYRADFVHGGDRVDLVFRIRATKVKPGYDKKKETLP